MFADAIDRYSRRIAIVHWLTVAAIAVTIPLALAMTAAPIGESKLAMYQAHAIIGDLVLILVLLRIYYRIRDPRPLAADAGKAFFNGLAKASHRLLYALLLLVPLSGIATLIASGMVEAFASGLPSAIPPDLAEQPLGQLHGLLAWGLTALVALHVMGALYHQFFLGDRLLRRMRLSRT